MTDSASLWKSGMRPTIRQPAATVGTGVTTGVGVSRTTALGVSSSDIPPPVTAAAGGTLRRATVVVVDRTTGAGVAVHTGVGCGVMTGFGVGVGVGFARWPVRLWATGAVADGAGVALATSGVTTVT